MRYEYTTILGRPQVKLYNDNNRFIEYRELLTCTRCSKEFIQPSKGHYNLYCEECANIVKLEKTKARMKRYRERKRQEQLASN